MEQVKIGCAKPAQPIKEVEPEQPVHPVPMEEKPMIQVGKPAPEFTAEAFYNHQFVEVNLSDYKGKWVYLCFYPGDFTFV